MAPLLPDCSDGIVNDGDGRTDWRPRLASHDPGCSSPVDTTEFGTTACDDGRDNDGDGRIDFRAGAKAAEGDPGCSGPGDPTEA